MPTRTLAATSGGVYTNAVALGANDDTTALPLGGGEKRITTILSGTFGGTVTVQLSQDGTNWVLGAAGVTAVAVIELVTTARFYRVISGSGVSAVVVRATVARTSR